jgi:hypothetical protein
VARAMAIIVGMSTLKMYRYMKKATMPSTGRRMDFHDALNLVETINGFTKLLRARRTEA